MNKTIQDLLNIVHGADNQKTRSSVELRQDRGALVESMRDIAATAETEKRSLNDRETRGLDQGETRFDALTEQITAAEAREAREADEAISISSPGARFAQPSRRTSETALLTGEQSLSEHVRNLGYRASDENGHALRFGHMIRGMLLGDWRAAEPERRALLESNAGSGGVLVPAPLSARVLDLARAQTRVLQAGAATVPMESSTLKIGRQTGDPSLTWHSEGETITPSDLTFDAVTLTAHTLPCLVKLSMELLEDVDNIDQLVTNAVARAMALELDRAALRGSGVDPEPLGIRNTSGVTILDADVAGGGNGAEPTWQSLVRAVAAVKGQNFAPNASISAVRTEVDLGTQTNNQGDYLAAPPLLDSLTRFDTTQVPVDLTKGTSDDASEIYVGQWDQLLIGMRTSFTVQPLNELYADSGTRGILCHLRADVAPAHASAFAVVDGVTPAS